MKMFRLFLFFQTFLFATLVCSEENQVFIQLKKEWKKAKSDSAKIKWAGDLCWEYIPVQLDSALCYARKEIYFSLKSKRKSDLGQAYSDIGSVFNRSGQYDSAVFYYKQSINIRHSLKQNEKLAGVYANLATVYTRLSKYKEAIEINYRALKIFELLNAKEKMANVLGNIGNLFYELNDNTNAQLYFHKALSLVKGSNDERLKASCLLHLGGLKLEAQDLDSSVYYYELSRKIYSDLNDLYGLGTLLNNLGSTYFKKGNADSAIINFEKALKLKNESGDTYGIGITYLYLGQAYQSKGDIDKALIYFEKCIGALKELGNHLKLIDAYAALARIYESKNMLTKSLENMRLMQAYKDSVYNDAQQRTLAEMQTKYESEKQETELKLNEEKLANEKFRTKIIIFFIVVIFACGLILVYFFYKRYTMKQIRMREESMRETREKERARIARELHDNIGSSVSFISSRTDSLLKEINENEELKKTLLEVKESSGEVMSGLRDTIWTLNKNRISNFELADKIKTYTMKHSLAEVKINDTMEAERGMDGEVVLNLFRCVQELVNNANKHSKATVLSIVFTESDKNAICIDISDNGIGFDPEEAKNKKGHYGLNNLSARMNEIGAGFTIISEPGQGTRCRLCLPLK
jgi:signal transduction histidine kinase